MNKEENKWFFWNFWGNWLNHFEEFKVYEFWQLLVHHWTSIHLYMMFSIHIYKIWVKAISSVEATYIYIYIDRLLVSTFISCSQNNWLMHNNISSNLEEEKSWCIVNMRIMDTIPHHLGLKIGLTHTLL